MNLSYREPIRGKETLGLAETLVDVLVASGMTYEKADEALAAAQEILMKNTRPVTLEPRPQRKGRQV